MTSVMDICLRYPLTAVYRYIVRNIIVYCYVYMRARIIVFDRMRMHIIDVPNNIVNCQRTLCIGAYFFCYRRRRHCIFCCLLLCCRLLCRFI